jgi:hypothetical protein
MKQTLGLQLYFFEMFNLKVQTWFFALVLGIEAKPRMALVNEKK